MTEWMTVLGIGSSNPADGTRRLVEPVPRAQLEDLYNRIRIRLWMYDRMSYAIYGI